MPFFFHSESQFLTTIHEARNLSLFTYSFNTGIFINLMQSDKDILGMVISRFPEQANSLTKLFYKDENFKEVCEDYYLCKEAMNKIIITNASKRKILKDYKTALKELEIEMLMHLDSKITEYDD